MEVLISREVVMLDQWHIRPICNSEVVGSLESGGFEDQKSAPCTVLSILRVIDIQSFLWRRRRQRLGDVVGLVVYCPSAYVPHGRGRTDTNVMKEIGRRVEKNGLLRLYTCQWGCMILWNQNWILFLLDTPLFISSQFSVHT